MNRLAAVWQQGVYQPRHHWVMTLDDLPLDVWMAEHKLSEHQYHGLVPALGNLERRDESAVAWQRILPLPGCKAIAPLLICPEHQDFSCLVVMAEVSHDEDCIRWLRFGINRASAPAPDDLGDCVEWLSGIEPLCFDKAEYRACLARFHLLRLDQEMGLSGKKLSLRLSNPDHSDSESLTGRMQLGPEGLMLESLQGDLLLSDDWLPLMLPGTIQQDTDFILTLNPEALPPGLLQPLQKS